MGLLFRTPILNKQEEGAEVADADAVAVAVDAAVVDAVAVAVDAPVVDTKTKRPRCLLIKGRLKPPLSR